SAEIHQLGCSRSQTPFGNALPRSGSTTKPRVAPRTLGNEQTPKSFPLSPPGERGRVRGHLSSTEIHRFPLARCSEPQTNPRHICRSSPFPVWKHSFPKLRLAIFCKNQKRSTMLLEDEPMNDRIMIDPQICHGKPVIRGTRTPVTVILDALAGGDSFETLEREYAITADDIRAYSASTPSETANYAYHPLKD